MAEERTNGRGTIATVVATAAVTLAIGVTAAALGGYLAPAQRDGGAVARSSEPMVVESRPATQAGAPNVVLVPVAPDRPREPPAAVPTSRESDVVLAAHEPTEHDDDDDHHRGRGNHEREHEHERDHDDDD